MNEDKEAFREGLRDFTNKLEAEVTRYDATQKLIEIIRDPPVYSLPFLGDSSEHVQNYRKDTDSWYCRLLRQVRILEEKTNG